MSSAAPFGLRRPLRTILRERSDARRATLRPQVDSLLQSLRAMGVVCEVIGSFARENVLFLEGSDIDVLIIDAGAHTDGELWNVAHRWIRAAGVDLVFSRDLSPEWICAMRHHARS